MKGFGRWWLGSIARWLTRRSRDADPWERLPYSVPAQTFGRGSVHPFPWYFEGESAVDVHSVDDVCTWLQGCDYVRDPDLFNESDFWQHPRTFERLRVGDCEDHALWAWRKLVELGFQAELVSGTWQPPAGPQGGHVWVRFRQEGRDYILESVNRTRELMVRPLEEVRAEYVPHAGVDHEFRQYAYSGYLRGTSGERASAGVIVALLPLSILVWPHPSISQAASLREPYIERDVCPFECCQYGPWKARGAVRVYRSEGSSHVAFTLLSQSAFVAEAGNMHFAQLGIVQLDRAFALGSDEDRRQIPRGARVYVLSYQGEGGYRIWYDGHFYDVESFWDDRHELPRPNGRPGVMIREPKEVWWVRIRTRDGHHGWLRMDESDADGTDACG